jgi:hypothetical protein
MFDVLEDPEDTRSGSFESYFFIMQEFLAQPFLFQVIFRSETGGAIIPKNTISTKQGRD